MVLSWYEHLSTDEIPPRWMWPFPSELEKWFEQVEEARREGVKFTRPEPSGAVPRWAAGARNDLVKLLEAS